MFKAPIYFAIIIFLFNSCAEPKKNGIISEGIIIYDVDYIESEKDNPLITLLPTTVKLKFKNNNINLLSEGYLGFFSTRFVSKLKNETSNILMKVLNNKLNYEFGQNELAFIYNNEKNEISYTDSTKLIAGINCKMAIIQSKSHNPIIVFYTDRIQLKSANRNTPYNDLNGVLMEFQVSMNNIETRFTAREIREIEVDESEFAIPTNFKSVNIDEMKKYMGDFSNQ